MSLTADPTTAVAAFRAQMVALTQGIADKALDGELDAWLNQAHGTDTANLLPNGRIEFTGKA